MNERGMVIQTANYEVLQTGLRKGLASLMRAGSVAVMSGRDGGMDSFGSAIGLVFVAFLLRHLGSILIEYWTLRE
jgi:hypothetical protein